MITIQMNQHQYQRSHGHSPPDLGRLDYYIIRFSYPFHFSNITSFAPISTELAILICIWFAGQNSHFVDRQNRENSLNRCQMLRSYQMPSRALCLAASTLSSCPFIPKASMRCVQLAVSEQGHSRASSILHAEIESSSTLWIGISPVYPTEREIWRNVISGRSPP